MELAVMPGRPATTHDLIRLREPIALTVDAPVPAWVEPALDTDSLGGRPSRPCP